LELHDDALPPETLAAILDPKNSNQAFGVRMGIWLVEMIAAPVSFLPSSEERYAALLPYCQTLSPLQANAMRSLLGPESSRGFTPIPATANLTFPEANVTVLGSMVGWYFFVGSCTGSDGAEYGVEMMFFRSALLPPALASSLGLSDIENQVVELHFAVSKAGERHYQAKPILIAGTSGFLSFSDSGLGATMGKNAIRQVQPDSLFPLQIQAWGQDDGAAELVQFAIDLTFASGRDYLLQGANGCTPCCDGVGTIYYSIPDLQLDPAASTLTLQGEEIALTAGTFWCDHQWGTLVAAPDSAVVRAANNLQPPSPGGWDWFEAQFAGDRQITVAAPHGDAMRAYYFQTGPTPPDTMHVPVFGKFMDAAGVTHAVNGTLDVTEWIKSQKSPAPDLYPPTQTWYPNRWEFQFGADVDEDIRLFVMEPIVSGGQSGFFASGAQYSEGAVILRDAAGQDVGRGFAESVAYADTLANELRLAGLPASDEMLAMFGAQAPSEDLVLASKAYVALHATELQQITETCQGLT
jgi:predicted secreted hydrolase